MTPAVALALGLLALTLVLLVIGIATYDRGRRQRSIARRRARLSLRSERVPPWRRTIQSLVLRSSGGRSVDERLRRAGHHDVLAGDVIVGALVGAALLTFLASRLVTMPAALILAVGALVGANRYLDRLVRLRAEKFAEQLPDIARVLSNAAGAGMAISNALALTAREMEEPAATLLGDAVRRMAVGQSLAEAMEELKERVPSREMAVLVSTLVIQQRTGGDVIEALREMSTNLEVRRDLKREVTTVMSGVKFTAYAVMGLGIATLLLLEGINPGTLRNMTSQLAGQIVLIVAALFYFAGFAAVRKISRVEV